MTGPEFDLFGALPTGTTVLEASAGTGKTFTIAALVARYVAEGSAALEEMLVVTFGRAATQELRDRVRERLVTARDGLADPAAARAGGDELLCHLASAADDEVEQRRARLAVALSSFDAATVVTTHQFCEQMLIGLGAVGDVDSRATLVDNLDDLTVEVVQDLYLRKWGVGDAQRPPLNLEAATQLARTVVNDSQATLAPDATEGDDVASTRVRFARAVRIEVDKRKRARRVYGFDDILTRLQRTLAGASTGPAAVARLRTRYRIVLVDEFQDTDPVQWDILRRAFHGYATLVLIGDPKQAIYAFRGADVQAYLAAAEVAGERSTLATNWRSDGDLLRGLDAVFRGAALGDPRIVVAPVAAAFGGRRLATGQAPVQLRLIPRGADLKVDPVRRAVVADVVEQIAGLLRDAPMLTPRGGPARPVRPGDIAVIVRTGAQLDLVHTALLSNGIPSVQRTTASVFATAAAADWIVLLEALEQPHRAGRVRRLAVSPFVGWDAHDLETKDVDALGEQVRAWISVAESRGIAALFESISRDERLLARLLAEVDGERRVTDLRHVGEALHAGALAGSLGLTAALEWLRHRAADAATDSAVERSRRLDSDAAAVQVVTVHASKGLEFPIVAVPFAWDRFQHDVDVPLFHRASNGRPAERVRNVGGPGSQGFDADRAQHNTEEFGEDLRLLYVAMTRAQAQVTAWWAASSKNTTASPLHRLLFTSDPAAGIAERVAVPGGDRAALAGAAPLAVDGALSITMVPAGATSPTPTRPSAAADLDVARLARDLDTAWRRTSYTALTSAAHDAPPTLASEPEVVDKDDEPETATSETGGTQLRELPSPMADLPGGTGFGTLVHAVLEETDLQREGELTTQVARQKARFGPADLDETALAAALRLAADTPVLGELTLASVPKRDRLAEMEFELPLCGGDRPSGIARLGDLAGLLRAHLDPDDPLAGYADRLEDPELAPTTLRGYLTGSIDAVLRVDGRYVIVDYKTNRLAPRDEPLTAWHYRAGAMTEAMLNAHYPLQALLYEIALHRFLRWRVAGYDPAEHLGGALYLFLRGMCGPGVAFADGSAPGVFRWQPPAALVTAASDVLAGHR